MNILMTVFYVYLFGNHIYEANLVKLVGYPLSGLEWIFTGHIPDLTPKQQHKCSRCYCYCNVTLNLLLLKERIVVYNPFVR